MSIIIRNLGGDLPFGECEYEVRINELVITTFKHTRTDGLSVCLTKAAKAVTQQQWLNASSMFEQL